MPSQCRHPGRRTAWSLACAATISRWTPASTSFASARVRPESAMSTRPSGRLISTTSAHDPSPSAPLSTSLKTQATYPPSVRERARKYPTAVAPPISRRSPRQRRFAIAQAGQKRDPGLETAGNLANVGLKLWPKRREVEMSDNRHPTCADWVGCVFALILSLGALPANAGVLSTTDVLAKTGQSIDAWGAAWWQNAFVHPDLLGDTTGEFGYLGNVGGPVFFAEGSGGDPVSLSY